MAKERYGNGCKGGAATPRKMHSTFRGFADHSARSLKPVHKRKGARRAMRNTIDQTVRCVLRMALRNQAWRVLSLSHIRCGTIGTPRVPTSVASRTPFAVSTYNTFKERKHIDRATPPSYRPNTDRKQGKREKPKPRKDKATPAKQRVVGTGPRTREEGGTGERPRCSHPGREHSRVLCKSTSLRTEAVGTILERCMLRSAPRLCRPLAGSPRWGRARTGAPRPVHP